jgi:hypothetical protein
VDLLGVVAGFGIGEFLCDDAVMVRSEVAQRELALAENIDTRQARDPVGVEAGQAGNWV